MERARPRRKTKESSEDALDAFEAAWFIGAHVETVRRLARRGEIPAYKVGKDWRFSRKVLEQWRETHHLRGRQLLALVVDGEKDTRVTIGLFLEQAGYRVVFAATGRDALDAVKHEIPDVVLLDLVMLSTSGVEFLEELHSLDPDVPVVIVTGHTASDLINQALTHPPVTLLPKPVEKAALLRAVRLVLHGSARTRRGSG